MKNTKVVLIFLIGVIYLSSCDKEENLTGDDKKSKGLNILDLLTGTTVSQSQGTVALSAYGVGNSTEVDFNASASPFLPQMLEQLR